MSLKAYKKWVSAASTLISADRMLSSIITNKKDHRGEDGNFVLTIYKLFTLLNKFGVAPTRAGTLYFYQK